MIEDIECIQTYKDHVVMIAAVGGGIGGLVGLGLLSCILALVIIKKRDKILKAKRAQKA